MTNIEKEIWYSKKWNKKWNKILDNPLKFPESYKYLLSLDVNNRREKYGKFWKKFKESV